MPNDTSGPDPDSHAIFIDPRNEGGDEGVASGMDTDDITTDTKDYETSPIIADVRDTGELEPVPSTSASAIESAPFDYDRYYDQAPGWPPPHDAVAPEPAPAARNRDGILFFGGAVAAAILGAALTVGLLAATGTLSTEREPLLDASADVEATVTTVAPRPEITNTIVNEIGAAVNPAAVALKTVPSIVTVTITDSEDAGSGSGSGVVITEDGYIATNEHVVNGGAKYFVTFEDGRVYEAELVGDDALTDLAVLKIEADDVTPIELGSSELLSLGDPAVAVGNPLGQRGGASISVGIISAFDRQVDFADGSSLFGMIQTDAAINNGSSGGALVDAEGRLIGITSAIGVSTSGPEGIGYAIPVELVQRITDEIIEIGDVAHPFLGVTIGTFVETLPDGAQRPAGAEVVTIEGTDSAAGTAGLQAGDVIVRIGDTPIASQTDLILAVRLYRVGDEVEFEALRDGEAFTVTVVMGQRPAEFGG